MSGSQSARRPGGLRRLWVAAGGLQFVLTIGLILAARTVLAAPYYVPSGSMEPTLEIGDEMLSLNYAYGYSRFSPPIDLGPSVRGRWLGKMPERGDVVVFRPPNHPSETWVKRLIGLPGDRIQMRHGRLWINGTELPLRVDGAATVETGSGARVPALRLIERLPNGREHPILKTSWSGPLDDTPVFVVPADHVFMMGDNRDNSLDSRVPQGAGGPGFVDIDNLIGRARVVLGSWDFPNAGRTPSSWVAGLRLSRFFSPIG